MINLTQEERDKFATYLEQEVESSRQLIEQMEHIPNTTAMSSALTAEMLAERVVARKLRSVEIQSVGG